MRSLPTIPSGTVHHRLAPLRVNSEFSFAHPRCVRCVAAHAAEQSEASSSSLSTSSGAERMIQSGRTLQGKKLTSQEVNVKVEDIMTSPVMSLPPDMSVFEAMMIMVDKRISGMPVTDEQNKVIGVCSGYDLLALDSTPGKLDKSFFPPIDTCINEFGGDRAMMWSNFKHMRRKLQTANCDTVGQVMHKAFTINKKACMEDAANMVVQKRAHRICVLDDNGELVGIVSRGDIMRATIAHFKVYMKAEDKKEEKTEAAAPV